MNTLLHWLLFLAAFLLNVYRDGAVEAKVEGELGKLTDLKFYKPTEHDMALAHQGFLSQRQFHTSRENVTLISNSTRTTGNRPNRNREKRPNRRSLEPVVLRRDVSAQEESSARALVRDVQRQFAAYNKWNIENPRFNHYWHKKPGEEPPPAKRDAVPMPRLDDATIKAIQLVGDLDTQAMANNGTLPVYEDEDPHYMTHNPESGAETTFQGNTTLSKRADGAYWLGNVDHNGGVPFGGDSSYRVWRNVQDYGAQGDGITDDTDAIQRAISDGNRCGENCPGSTVKGAVVYFPYGVYRVSGTIISYFDTQIVGEVAPAGGLPIIEATPSFTGFAVFSTNVYLPDGVSEWYINTANFYRQFRNFVIDIRLASQENMKAIHWQVAQAASIENVKIYMTDKSSSDQVGIFAENGSGGWFSDITINGGLYGFLGGNQQYSVSDISVNNAKNGIGIIWDWAWSWTRLALRGCDVGIDLTAPGSNPDAPVGSVMLVDSYFQDCNAAVKTFPFKSTDNQQGTTVLSFNNIGFRDCGVFILFPDNRYIDLDVSDSNLEYLQLGNLAYGGDTQDGWFDVNMPRPSELTNGGGDAFSPAQEGYFRKPKPLYYSTSVSSILNVKVLAAGDGVTDDTEALQVIFDYAAANNLMVYVPAGSYMISQPIVIPSNSYVVGEAWSQFMAYGPAFGDEFNPQPMIVVGNDDVGDVELQNLIFTSRGALPGLILVYWNIRAASKGSAGMWDCHFRVGGAIGTDLQIQQCPKLTGSIRSECIAGSIMFFVSPSSNGYFENVWAWVADHDIDDPHQDTSNQIDIYFARGMLIMTDGPSWFRASGSEHSVIYQYSLVEARNVYMSIIQTESPYFQGGAHVQAPAPFASPLWIGDPAWDMCGEDLTNCNMAWALLVQWSEFIFIDGTGLYSWFHDYTQQCVDDRNCQQRLINIYHVGFSYFNHIVTIGAVEALTPAISEYSNDIKYTDEHLQATSFPWWTTIATYLENTDGMDMFNDRFPITEGWVSFGDSYAAGIGAGKPLDSNEPCLRGTGSYVAILDDIIQFSHDVVTEWQIKACSGETAQQFIDGVPNDDDNTGKQIVEWDASSSDLGTCSFTGNDLGFGDIVSHCIMGYPLGSRSKCQPDIARARSILESNKVQELVHESMDAILAKASPHKDRFIVYWTSYPKFFAVDDSACNDCFFQEGIWAGHFLTEDLRHQLNALSADVNDQIDFAIRRYNAGRPYPKVVHANLEALGNIYQGKRFCERGVKETLKSEEKQATVAFFYDNGYDDIPGAGESFRLPQKKVGAPDDWSIKTYNSGTCVEDDQDPLVSLNCGVAKSIANGTFDTSEYDGEITANSDGSVTITDYWVRFKKMFHPKTRANWHIAQAVMDALRRN